MNASIPTAFWQRIEQQLPLKDLAIFQQALNSQPYTSLRLNPHKHSGAPLFPTAEIIPWHPRGRFLEDRPSFVADPLFHAGTYYVQEASSMLLYQAIDWRKDQHILDLCAAPGGKSTLIASAMSANSYLVSNDPIPQRASILKENMQRWGHANTTITNSHAEKFAASGARFDVIVVDAPCSGEGMFRKDEVAVTQWSPQLVESCAARQQDILKAILPCLKAGGTLIYSTCTYAPSEDEAIVTWLLETSSLELAPLPNFGIYGASPIAIEGSEHVAYRCYPHHFRGEGFFIAKFQKPTSEDSNDTTKSVTPSVAHKVTKVWLADYLSQDVQSTHHIVEKDKHLYLRANHAPQLNRVKVLQEGLELAKRFGSGQRGGLNPLHGLAMSPWVQANKISLDRENALRYLSKLEVDISSTAKGWHLATYQNIPLGWLKASGGRLNNYYPTQWRIRKDFNSLFSN